jgi:hypothetical protein
MTPVTSDTDLTARLAEALRYHRFAWPEGRPVMIACACGYQPSSSLDMEDHRAAALLPVVREAAALLAAEKVTTVAAAMAWPNSQNCGPELLACAAALRAGAGQ